MALMGDIQIDKDEIRFKSSTAAEQGNIACFGTSGSGNILGDAGGYVQVAASPSGLKVAGLYVQTVGTLDETLYHRNFHKSWQKVGEPVCLMKKGNVVVNNVTGTPAIGDTLYLTTNGNLTTTLSATGGLVATPKVGQAEGIKDANGYVPVSIDIPVL